VKVGVAAQLALGDFEVLEAHPRMSAPKREQEHLPAPRQVLVRGGRALIARARSQGDHPHVLAVDVAGQLERSSWPSAAARNTSSSSAGSAWR
jgi:hypothetical protein